MLFHFLYELKKYFGIFNVFGYITFRAVVAFIISFLLAIIFFPKFIEIMKRWKASQIIRKDGPASHFGKSGTPTMGGFLVVISIVITMLICGNFNNLFIIILIGSTILFAFIGFLDDYLKITRKSSDGLHAKFKLISQIFVSLIITILIYIVFGKESTKIAIPFFKNIFIDISFFYIPFGVFFIVGFSNAVNLTDGLDGLAAGLLVPVFGTFGLLSYVIGHKEMAEYLYIPYLPLASEVLVYCLAAIGGIVAFLWFNSHPAEIFMGDTGSISFGGIIGTIAMMIKQELLLVIIGGVFVMETLSVIIQVLSYKLTKKRVFLMAPLHHHFELKGWQESKVITRLWILGGIFAIIAIGSLKLR